MSDDRGERIAIVGLAGRFPGANDLTTFWSNLVDGVESVYRFPVGADDPPGYVPASAALDGLADFDAALFGMSPREAEITDPQHRLFLECCLQALEDAGCDPSRTDGRIGVYGGSALSSYLLFNLMPWQTGRYQQETYPAGLLHGNDKDHLTTRVSYRLGLTGPAVTVQTACSTSLVAVVQACQSLLDYQCDVALAGGVSVKLPQDRGYIYEPGGILSPDGHCRPFDAHAAGTVFGSGVGVVTLKRLSDALADGDPIRAVILGGAINNDGSDKAGYSAPGLHGQASAVAEAYELAGVSPSTVGYIEAHGTGTAVGDPLEIAALSAAFAGHEAPPGGWRIGSVKGNVGHLNAASGVASLIKTVLAVSAGYVPPTANFTEFNPRIPRTAPFVASGGGAPWPHHHLVRRAGISSFGIGGTNAHVVIEQAPEQPVAVRSGEPEVIVVSAAAPAALAQSAARLADFLDTDNAPALASVAHTLRTGRRQLRYRAAIVAANPQEAAHELRRVAAGTDPVPVEGDLADIAFLFPGQGVQYTGMATALYRRLPEFRADVDQCVESLRSHLDADLYALLTRAGDPGADPLRDTALAQPALFVVEYALARLWQRAGVHPTVLLGHSIGEWVAACLSGVFELPDALALVAARGRLMQAMPPGAMLAARIPVSLATELAVDGIDLAALNGPDQVTFAGSSAAIDRLAAHLSSAGHAVRTLATDRAFHSASVDMIVEPFAEQISRVSLRPPTIPIVSNVTGAPLTATQAMDPWYWARQARAAVRFGDGVRHAATSCTLMLEVGPGRTLTGLAAGNRVPATLIASLGRRQETGDERAILAAAGDLWTAGAPIDWTALLPNPGTRKVSLPGYAFQRVRYWIDPPGFVVADEPDVPETVVDPAAPDDVQAAVTGFWSELLGIPDIAPDDDFFVLGGDSLLATQLASRARAAFGVELPLDQLLDSPTIARMVEMIETELDVVVQT